MFFLLFLFAGDSLEDTFAKREIAHPQWAMPHDQKPLLIWHEKKAVFALKEGQVSLVNPKFGADAYPFDDARVDVAVGPDNKVVMTWADNGAIRAAESLNGGASFQPSVLLNEPKEGVYAAFPVAGYAQNGQFFVAWIDGREAQKGHEEPAHIFVASLKDGEVKTIHLTQNQSHTVCGCCRPDMRIHGSDLSVAFRRDDSQGYRDIWASTINLETSAISSHRMGEPLWKIKGCPMSGPLFWEKMVLWNDGSKGSKRLMRGALNMKGASPIVEGPVILHTPRRIAGSSLLLLPGEPAHMYRVGDGAVAVGPPLPSWVISGLQQNGTIQFVGAQEGRFTKLAIKVP